MKLGLALGLGYLALLLVLSWPENKSSRSVELTLLNASYDPTRELYKRASEAFVKSYEAKTGRLVQIKNSHGGSGSQSRAVIDGLKADIVTLALAYDIDAIARRGLLSKDWENQFPNHSSPYTSTIVFVVRKGNPKNIRDWNDLVREDVSVITANPKTSGGARWNVLAAWGHVVLQNGSESNGVEFLRKLFSRVPVLDTGARGSTSTFVQKRIGDVLITWENEARLAVKNSDLEIHYPQYTILTEPPVATVDVNVETRGTREVAGEFVRYLYSDEGQALIADSGFRPTNPKFAAAFPKIERLFTIRDLGLTWDQAHKKFFDDGGIFDQIYGSRN
jgi:sulfate transport system substrate-binding protein